MKKLAVAVGVALVGLSLGVLAQNPRIDGRWDIKITMVSIPGLDLKGMQMPATATTSCITKEEAADPQKLAPPAQGRGAASDCKVSDYKVVGNKVTYNVKCTTPPATMVADMVYGPDSYEGTMTTQTARGGGPSVMKYSAKRLGDCVK